MENDDAGEAIDPGEENRPGTFDRRAALKKGAIGVGAAGALWAAPSVMGFDAAFAGSSCAQRDTLDWTPYSGLTFSSKTYPAISSFSALTVTHPAITTVGSGVVAVAPNDAIVTQNFGGQSAAYYQIQMNNTKTGVGYNATFNFSATVYNLKFTLFDIDYTASSWKDTVWIGGTFTGFSTNRTGFSTPATFSGSGTVGTPWTGTAGAASSVSNGNVNVVMTTCSTFTLSFRSTTPIGTSQRIGLGNLTWCR
jgi:hypothetical protein